MRASVSRRRALSKACLYRVRLCVWSPPQEVRRCPALQCSPPPPNFPSQHLHSIPERPSEDLFPSMACIGTSTAYDQTPHGEHQHILRLPPGPPLPRPKAPNPSSTPTHRSAFNSLPRPNPQLTSLYIMPFSLLVACSCCCGHTHTHTPYREEEEEGDEGPRCALPEDTKEEGGKG